MALSVRTFQRSAFFFAVYGFLAALSLWFAYELRFSGADAALKTPPTSWDAYLHQQRPAALLWVIPLKVLLLGLAGQFRGVFYYLDRKSVV